MVPASLTTFLPLQHEVPSDLQVGTDQHRNLAEVAANYSDPATTQGFFTAWGWEGNVTRSYSGVDPIYGVTSVYASVHRFGGSMNAEHALAHSLDNQASSTGAWEIPVDLLATTRAIATSSEVTISLQEGDLIIRLTVVSPSREAIYVAERIVRAVVNRAFQRDEANLVNESDSRKQHANG